MATMMLSKERKGLSKTLIGKAIELRNSIPWANPSAIVLLDDPRRPGKKKVRPWARWAVIALSVALAGETVYVLTRKNEVYEVVTAPPDTKPIAKPVVKAEATPPAPAPKPVEKPPPPKAEPPPVKAAAPAPPAAKQANGTLVVNARHAGKAVTGAMVRINGVSLWTTPVNATVLPGVYTVKIDKAGFGSEKRAGVEVKAAKKVVLTVDLKK
jgi:hypothetical protein